MWREVLRIKQIDEPHGNPSPSETPRSAGRIDTVDIKVPLERVCSRGTFDVTEG